MREVGPGGAVIFRDCRVAVSVVCEIPDRTDALQTAASRIAPGAKSAPAGVVTVCGIIVGVSVGCLGQNCRDNPHERENAKACKSDSKHGLRFWADEYFLTLLGLVHDSSDDPGTLVFLKDF